MKNHQLSICIYGLNYAPEMTGIAKYTTEMAEWLAQRGHKVKVVSAHPYYPKWRVFDGYNVWSYTKENINNVSVMRCPLWVPREPTFFKRVLHLLSYNIALIPLLLMNSLKKQDVVISIQPPIMIAPLVLLVSKLTGSKKWMHVQDLEINAAIGLGLVKSKFITNIFLVIEKWILSKFDVVSTISDALINQLSSKGVKEGSQYSFINWVDINIIYPLGESSPMRKELKFSHDDVVVLYSGSLGEKQGANIFEYCAKTFLSDSKIKFVLCAEGPQVNELKSKLSGLRNVKWIPLQPNNKLNNLLNLADIHLLPQLGSVSDFAMPSKLTGMLASGRPIVATANSDTDLFEIVNQAGIAIECNDMEGFCDAIRELSVNEDKRKMLGDCGREIAESKLNKDLVLSEFESRLLKLVN